MTPIPPPYRRATRPVTPESFPPFVDRELERLAAVLSNIIVALKDLDARLTVGGL